MESQRKYGVENAEECGTGCRAMRRHEERAKSTQTINFLSAQLYALAVLWEIYSLLILTILFDFDFLIYIDGLQSRPTEQSRQTELFFGEHELCEIRCSGRMGRRVTRRN